MNDSYKPLRSLTPLPRALTLANRKSDYVVFLGAAGLILLPFVVAIWFVPSLWMYLTFIGLAVVSLMIMVRVMQIQLMSNAMRIQNSQFAHLKADIVAISDALGVPPVDVFVVQEPSINAYSVGVAKPYAIVLHSATLERLTYDEMRAIFIHEIGHVRFRHTILSVYVSALSLLPVIGVGVSWLFGFWARRAEYTADRLAVAYTGDPELVIKSLIKVHAGPLVGNKTSKEFMIYQDAASDHWLRRFSQTFSSHPYLVNRIKAILRFADQNGFAMAPDLRDYVRTRRKS